MSAPPTTMHAAFLADILAHPDDDTPRLIYADWLEDQDTEESRTRGNFIRTQVALAATIAGMRARGADQTQHNPDWMKLQADWYNCRSWLLDAGGGRNLFAWFPGFPQAMPKRGYADPIGTLLGRPVYDETSRGALSYRRVVVRQARTRDPSLGDLHVCVAGENSPGGWQVCVRRGWPERVEMPLHEWALFGEVLARGNPFTSFLPVWQVDREFLRGQGWDVDHDWWLWDRRTWDAWAEFHAEDEEPVRRSLRHFGRHVGEACRHFASIMSARAFGAQDPVTRALPLHFWNWDHASRETCARWFTTQALRLLRGLPVPTEDGFHEPAPGPSLRGA